MACPAAKTIATRSSGCDVLTRTPRSAAPPRLFGRNLREVRFAAFEVEQTVPRGTPHLDINRVHERPAAASIFVGCERHVFPRFPLGNVKCARAGHARERSIRIPLIVEQRVDLVLCGGLVRIRRRTSGIERMNAPRRFRRAEFRHISDAATSRRGPRASNAMLITARNRHDRSFIQS